MLLAIDIGSNNICLVEGNYKSGKIEITNSVEAKLFPYTVIDGANKNSAFMVMLINKLLRSKNIKTLPSVITFNNSNVLSRRLELPMSKPRELDAMVKNEMIQMSNDSGDTVVEYSIIKKVLPKSSTVSIWAYAIDKDLVDEYYTLYKNLKLKPVAMDVHPNSVEKLFTDAEINGDDIKDKSVLFADICENTIEFHLFSDNERVFSRITPLETSEFESIFGNMGHEAVESGFNTLDVSPSRLKENNVLAEIVGKYFNHMADEFQKMIQFQLRRDSQYPVRNIYLYGSMSCIKGITGYVSSLLGINVQVINTVSKIKCSEDINIANFINAAGALIRV